MLPAKCIEGLLYTVCYQTIIILKANSERLTQLNSTGKKTENRLGFCQSRRSEHFQNWLSWVESGALNRPIGMQLCFDVWLRMTTLN